MLLKLRGTFHSGILRVADYEFQLRFRNFDMVNLIWRKKLLDFTKMCIYVFLKRRFRF